MAGPFLFPGLELSGALVNDLRRMNLNPWWEGRPLPVLPSRRRHLVGLIQQRFAKRLAPVVVVPGPRQIGKTTAQMQVLEALLDRGVPPPRILRVQFDDLPEISRLSEPILRSVDWYEKTILGRSLNEAARASEPTHLFFDEVQIPWC